MKDNWLEKLAQEEKVEWTEEQKKEYTDSVARMKDHLKRKHHDELVNFLASIAKPVLFDVVEARKVLKYQKPDLEYISYQLDDIEKTIREAISKVHDSPKERV